MQPLPLAYCHSITSLDGLDVSRYRMEPKLDGVRLQIVIADEKVAMYTRTNHVATGKLPAIDAALKDYDLRSAHGTVIDGEAVYLDENGAADFNFTARVMGSGTDVAVTKQRTAGKYLSFVAFDLLYLAGRDLRGEPLMARSELLDALWDALGSDHFQVVEYTTPTADQHREFVRQYGEGSVVKLRTAPYKAGRSKNFLKWKKQLDADVVVMGATEGKGKYVGQIGAVRFGQYRDGALVERGQCSGMTDDLRKRLSDNLPIGSVMVITHNGLLVDGFRHPQFSHFRTDKLAEECEWDA